LPAHGRAPRTAQAIFGQFGESQKIEGVRKMFSRRFVGQARERALARAFGVRKGLIDTDPRFERSSTEVISKLFDMSVLELAGPPLQIVRNPTVQACPAAGTQLAVQDVAYQSVGELIAAGHIGRLLKQPRGECLLNQSP